MTSTETTLALSFDDLAKLVEKTPGLCVRIQRADGSVIEGDVLSLAETDLFVLDEASGQHVQVFAHELRALDVRVPRRAREWTLALAAIPVATALLIGYARLPWVHPEGSRILPGYMVPVTIGAGVIAVVLLQKQLQSWLTKWRRIYPPVAP